MSALNSKKTVLITGASTGIGRAAARYFANEGWNVVATMRSPEKEKEFLSDSRILCLPLDVTKPETIARAFETAQAQFGALDVVVNNAGYGLIGPFEATSREQIQRQFDTNVFGLMEVTRAALPLLRARGQGVLVNVASMGGRLTVPLYSSYHATKWAVEGFTESLQFELAEHGVRVRLVEPGAIKTDFYERSADTAQGSEIEAYGAFTEKVKARMNAAGAQGATPEAVARVIYRAATSTSRKLRYPVGSDARVLLCLRRFLPDSWFSGIVRRALVR